VKLDSPETLPQVDFQKGHPSSHRRIAVYIVQMQLLSLPLNLAKCRERVEQSLDYEHTLHSLRSG